MAEGSMLPINCEDVQNLLHVLEKELPYSSAVFNWIRVQTHWKKNLPNIQVYILCPNGDWRTGVVFAFTKNLELNDQTYGAAYARESQVDIFTEFLRRTECIEWKKVSLIRGVTPWLVPGIKSIIFEKIGQHAINYDLLMYFMTADEARKVTPRPTKEAVTIDILRDEHVDQICTLWAHFSENYLPIVKAMVHNNLTVAIKQDDKLVSMVLESEYGGIAMAQTIPGNERKGFSNLAYSVIVKEMGDAGIDPHLYVFNANEVSRRQIENLGFKLITTTSSISVSHVRVKKFDANKSKLDH